MTRAWLMGAALCTAACDPAGLSGFTQGRSEEACIQNIPACAGVFARCELDSRRYTEVRFPGDIAFMVRADPLSEIEVRLFFAEAFDAGFETQIYWNEPGCSSSQLYDSEGADLFGLSDNDGYFAQSRVVQEGGEHLIEVISDMQARALVAVDIVEPES